MPDATSRIGAALSGRYRIERELGEGGMATVYLAEDLKHERRVALKVLKPELAVGPERFLEEIRITAGLQHPHIVPLHDSGEADGFLFYVMPYVEGETLRERIAREGRVAPDAARSILRDMADALEAAHAAGVIHRDVKPGNILLSGGHALVADFGIGRAVSAARSDDTRLTTVGTSVGTPTYMSPEQAAGDEAVNHHSDIYSAGVTAYEMLAGHPPFSGGPQAVVLGHLSRTPEPLEPEVAGEDPELASAIMRCLAKDPADRWPSAGDLMAALTRRGGEGPSATHRDRGPGRKAALTVSLAAVVLIFGGIWALGERRDATSPAVESDPAGTEAEVVRILVMPPEPAPGAEPNPALSGQLADAMRRSMSEYSDASIVSQAQLSRTMDTIEGPTSPDALAAATDADFVVASRYGSLAGELTLSMDVLHQDGGLFRSLAPLSADATSPGDLVDHAGRVAASLSMALTLHDERFATYLRMPEHPETARLWIRAVEESNREQRAQAIEFLYQVIEREPEWPAGYLQMRPNLIDSGRGAEWAALVEDFLPLVPTLNRGERAEWQFQQGETDEIRLAGAVTLFELFDGGGLTGYLVAFRALSRNRLELARSHLDALEWEHESVREWAPAWVLDAKVYHLREEYESELPRVLEGLARFPGDHRLMRDEIRAHIGLGAITQAEDLVSAVVERPLPAEEIWRVLHESALEFLAHGYPNAAERTFVHLIDWSSDHAEDDPYRLAHALYDAGRYEQALPHLERATGDEELEGAGTFRRMERLALLAMTLEGLGRSRDAERVVARFPQFDPGNGGLATLWLAAVAARGGDVEGTVDLLRRGFEGGLRYWDFSDALRDDFLHYRPEFTPVRDSPQFVQLMAPKEESGPGR
jgi:tetratricopeptide (TPR) repeat protein